jgi:hypothetical protein
MDIAGAQYGYQEPVMPWQEYEESRILTIFRSGPAPKSHKILQIREYGLEQLLYFVERSASLRARIG